MVKSIKKYKFKSFSLMLILFGVLSFVVKSFTQTTVGVDGLLHEPFFFLIPVGYLFVFSGLIGLLINKLVLNKK